MLKPVLYYSLSNFLLSSWDFKLTITLYSRQQHQYWGIRTNCQNHNELRSFDHSSGTCWILNCHIYYATLEWTTKVRIRNKDNECVYIYWCVYICILASRCVPHASAMNSFMWLYIESSRIYTCTKLLWGGINAETCTCMQMAYI